MCMFWLWISVIGVGVIEFCALLLVVMVQSMAGASLVKG